MQTNIPKPEIITLTDLDNKNSDEIRKRMMLLELHKNKGLRHEPYLETNNKRPGPSLDSTNAEKEEMI